VQNFIRYKICEIWGIELETHKYYSHLSQEHGVTNIYTDIRLSTYKKENTTTAQSSIRPKSKSNKKENSKRSINIQSNPKRCLCIDCGESIPQSRVDAVLNVQRCIKCQSLIEMLNPSGAVGRESKAHSPSRVRLTNVETDIRLKPNKKEIFAVKSSIRAKIKSIEKELAENKIKHKLRKQNKPTFCPEKSIIKEPDGSKGWHNIRDHGQFGSFPSFEPMDDND
jgi:RNA polymerase-binding transcription factor DksA